MNATVGLENDLSIGICYSFQRQAELAAVPVIRFRSEQSAMMTRESAAFSTSWNAAICIGIWWGTCATLQVLPCMDVQNSRNQE